MNDPPVPLWIITEKDGTVVCAHCTGCMAMAGLGKCCWHVASVLFYLEVWTRLNGKLACTHVKCSWILPTYVKEVSYAPVGDINFTSAKKMKERRKFLTELSHNKNKGINLHAGVCIQ